MATDPMIMSMMLIMIQTVKASPLVAVILADHSFSSTVGYVFSIWNKNTSKKDTPWANIFSLTKYYIF